SVATRFGIPTGSNSAAAVRSSSLHSLGGNGSTRGSEGNRGCATAAAVTSKTTAAFNATRALRFIDDSNDDEPAGASGLQLASKRSGAGRRAKPAAAAVVAGDSPPVPVNAHIHRKAHCAGERLLVQCSYGGYRTIDRRGGRRRVDPKGAGTVAPLG